MKPLVIVANRLPVELGPVSELRDSPGGLVTALSSITTDGTHWIGWAGPHGATTQPVRHGPLWLHPVPLSDEEVAGYYCGFANSTLWPLFHANVRPVRLDRGWWQTYRAVNERFAERVASVAPLGSAVWIHDYHLLLVAQFVRERRPDLRIGSFLHIPFPSPGAFATLPWRRELVDGMLGADVLGFQLDDDVENFAAAASRTAGVARRGQILVHRGRASWAQSFPISIDFEKWDGHGRAAHDEARRIRRRLGCKCLFLGVDRLDYTKGITNRLQAFGELLDEGVIDPASFCFVQIAPPTREGVASYRDERERVLALTNSINERHGRHGEGPVVYVSRAVDDRELAGWYRAADAMVVTSLADGMNLVAKEFVAARDDLDGALVVSEFAGASRSLDGAFVINPYDIDAIKSSLVAAVTAPRSDRRARMMRMRDHVRDNDVHRWADGFMERLVPTGRAGLPESMRDSVRRHPSSDTTADLAWSTLESQH